MSTRGVHKLVRGLRPCEALPIELEGNSSGGSYSNSESITYKSLNARRAILWAMDLASFSIPQLKLIIRNLGTMCEKESEGSSIILVDAELMEALIQATKDCDQKKLQDLCGQEMLSIIDEEEEEAEESDDEEEEGSHIDLSTRWSEGLISEDVEITNEVYSLSYVDFNSQELRKLVRKVHSTTERSSISEENKEQIDEAVLGANRSLTRFLRALAKSSPMATI